MTEETIPSPSIERYDAELSANVYCIPEQQALRFGIALLLTIYVFFLPGLLPTPTWLFIAALIAYAVAHGLLGYIEESKAPSHTINACISGLDIALLLPVLWFDPLPSTPTVLLIGLFIGLASLRHRKVTLARLSLLITLLSTITLLARAAHNNFADLLPLLSSVGIIGLLLCLMVTFHHHISDLRSTAELAPHNDPETGLATRSTLYAAAQLLWPLAHRQNMPVSLLYAIVDPVSALGDGIASRQRSLILAQTMAEVAKSQLRGSDILVRYDRLRFVFVLLDCPHTDADTIAQRLQSAFHDLLKATGHQAHAHISATWLPTLPLALDPMLSALHSALYRARQRGQAHAGAIFTDPEQLRNATK